MGAEGVQRTTVKPSGINIIENKDVPQKMGTRRGQGGDRKAPLNFLYEEAGKCKALIPLKKKL